MKSLLKFIAISFLVFNFFAVEAKAAGFSIKSIGNVDTSGYTFRKFWHTSLNPAISGDCVDGTVTIKIDDATDSSTCSNNTWSYQMPVQSEGEHQMSFTNNGTTINFSLRLGRDAASQYEGGKGGGEVLPATGVWETTLIIIAGAAAAFVASRKLWASAK